MTPVMIQETFGQRLTRRRKELHLTRLQLANSIGVVPSSVQAWEKGWHSPRLSLSQVQTLCHVLQMSLEELNEGLSL
jgi:DNA-binding XRE family transcriptional regulator